MDLADRAAALTWAAVAAAAWTHLGYPLLMRRAAAGGTGPTVACDRQDGALPAVTVLVAALDEEQVIGEKVRDCLAQDYPSALLEVLVVADGSTDRTAELARAAGARVLTASVAAGKSAAVNRGVLAATGELVCLTDANCSLSPGALRALATAAADPRVAVVSGAKVVVGAGSHGSGEGLYWRLESVVKAGESRYGCVMGAPGEVCAVRRSTFRPIPPGVLNDDYHLVCDALLRGHRVAYAPAARAVETVSARAADEMERRTRIAAGTWQTSLRHLRLADPRRGMTALAFGSHRLLRNHVVPLLLPGLLATSAAAASRHRTARWLLAAQVLGYGAGAAGWVTGRPALGAPTQFLLTNAAAVRGAARLAARRQPTVWRRAARGPWVPAAPTPAAPGEPPDKPPEMPPERSTRELVA